MMCRETLQLVSAFYEVGGEPITYALIDRK